MSISNHVAYYCFCTLVTCGSTIVELILLFKEVKDMKFFNNINRLITISQARTLERAAHILMCSDAHDDYFYQCCNEVAPAESRSNHQIRLGTRLTLVQDKVPATTTVAEVVTIHDTESTSVSRPPRN